MHELKISQTNDSLVKAVMSQNNEEYMNINNAENCVHQLSKDEMLFLTG